MHPHPSVIESQKSSAEIELRLTGTAEAIQFLIYTASELKTQLEQPADQTPKECTYKVKLLLLSCVRWISLALEMITSYH